MTNAELVRAASVVIPPVGAGRVIVTVDHVPGRRLPNGVPAGDGSSTTYRAAWLIDGLRRSAPFGPVFARPRDLMRFIALLTGEDRT